MPSGTPRLFTQKIQVSDADLWARLVAEVKKGDTISIMVKTVWPEEGRYYTALTSFESQRVPLAVASPAYLLEAAGSAT